MIIDEPRPLCTGCGKPLKRSTYFAHFCNRLPDGKEYPTTIEEAQSLVPAGHLIVRLKYAREGIRNHWGQVVDYDPQWHIYGANVWTGGYGAFGQCGTCLPSHKVGEYAASLKLLPVPETVEVAGDRPRAMMSAVAFAVGERVGRLAAAARGLAGRAAAGSGTAVCRGQALLPAAARRKVRSGSIGVPLGSYEFLHGPLSEVTDAELVEMWQALATRRFEVIGIFERDRGNRFARLSKDMLKVCMLKVRAVAEARGVSVDFVVPALLKFDGEDWYDLDVEEQEAALDRDDF
jgi:hypothetical protein